MTITRHDNIPGRNIKTYKKENEDKKEQIKEIQ